MAYTTINKSTDYFNTKLYAGTGSSNAITGVGHQPDFIWLKSRTNAEYHVLYDSVRGSASNYKQLYSNATNAEVTPGTPGLTAIGSDGFTLGTNDNSNNSSENFVSWNWKANGAGSANTDGSINSTVSANTTAGFSIVKYTGNATAGATVGHGLGSVPKMLIVRKYNTTKDWNVYHVSMGATKGMYINLTNTEQTHTNWNNTTPTSTVFSIGSDDQVNGSSGNYIAYCFAEKTGYSKFGTVNGNGNNDGPFVYTGFAPSFVLYKKYNGAGDWYFVDNKRPGYNDNDKRLYANTNQAEETYDLINLYSNGFKLTNSTHTYTNDSAGTYLYMAFGQSLVGSNNIPATAR